MSASEHKAAGDAAFGQQRFREAIEAYSQALACLAGAEDREMRGALLANRCLAWLQLGGDRPAAAAAASDDGASHHQQQRQALAQALLDAQQAVQLRPRWAKAHLRLAHAQAASGNTQAAAAAYSRAAVLDPALQPAVAKAQAALERDASRQRCLLVLQGHQGPIYDAAVREQVRSGGLWQSAAVAWDGLQPHTC